MAKLRTALLSLSLILAPLLSVPAQTHGQYEYADREGVWSVTTGDHAMGALRLSSTERALVVQKRDAIFDILQATSTFNPLKGVPLRCDKRLIAQADSRGEISKDSPLNMQVGVTIGRFFLNLRTNRVEALTVTMPRVEIVTNDIERAALRGTFNSLWYEGLYDDAGRALFLEPQTAGAAADKRLLYRTDDYTYKVAVTNGKPVWTAVSKEHFLRAMMAYVDGLRAAETRRLRLEGRPPLSHEQSFELKRRHVFDKELAALTPAQREEPAFYATPPIEHAMSSGLTDGASPGSRRVVTANPDYFDRSLPRTAVQLIACEFNFQRPLDLAEAGDHEEIAARTLHRLLITLEYDKLAALIERPRSH
jgi:hypothetical protein